MPIKLYPYQQTAIDDIRAAYKSGKRAPLFVLPTGGGKTFIFSYITKLARANDKQVLILVHRKELLIQASESLAKLGIGHALIKAGLPICRAPVQIASVQTLVNRMQDLDWLKPDLIVIDEAHHCVSNTWQRIIDYYSRARLLGVTATPIRLDGKGLSNSFDCMIEGPDVRFLIDNKFLSDFDIYAPPIGAEDKINNLKSNDYTVDNLTDIMDRPTITGCAIDHYKKLTPGKSAIAFCTSVKHAENVCIDFRLSGIPATSISGKNTDDEREQAINDLASGAIKILTSCDIISEGTDIPSVEVAILLRPTQSLGLYIQQVGRALRISPGKTKAIILDHVGNTQKHGFPDDKREWNLDGIKKSKKAKTEADIKIRQCPSCYYVHKPTNICPSCGHVYTTQQKQIGICKGELKKLERQEEVKKNKQERGAARTMQELIEVGKSRGMKNPAGWAYNVIKSRGNKR